MNILNKYFKVMLAALILLPSTGSAVEGQILGLSVNNPHINGSADNTLLCGYQSGVLTLESKAVNLQFLPLGSFNPIFGNNTATVLGGKLNITAPINSSGTLLPGGMATVTGFYQASDLSIKGVTLLTADITDYGIADGGSTDTADFELSITGGDVTTDPDWGTSTSGAIHVSLDASGYAGSSTATGFGADWDCNSTTTTLGITGLVEDCDISVTKTCFVIEPQTMPYECTKPIDTLTMVWDGAVNDITVKAYKGDTSATLLATINNVMIGDEVSVSGFAGSPNNVTWEIFDNLGGLLGTSIFHLSCSDVNMNGPEDCGLHQGDGKDMNGGSKGSHGSGSKGSNVHYGSKGSGGSKGSHNTVSDTAGTLNDWLLEGIVDGGGVLDCTIDSPASTDTECEVVSRDGQLCTKRPTSISFRYHAGDDCLNTANTQDPSKTSCADPGVNTAPVRIIVSKDDLTNVTLDTGIGATVSDQDIVVAMAATAGLSDFDSGSRIQIFDALDNLLEDITLHTSCSQPLAIGDRFGAMEVVGFANSQQGEIQSGAPVKYTYTVTNNNSFDLYGIALNDDKLVPTTVPGSPIDLLAGEMGDLDTTIFIDETVTNTVTATATGPSGQACEASASATVTVTAVEPPPCKVKARNKIKLKKKKLTWKLQNTGSSAATIERIEITWPSGTNGDLTKIKLGKKEIVSMDETGGSADIMVFNGSLADRTVKAGKKKTLKFVFDNNVKRIPSAYTIKVTFAEGCGVIYESTWGGGGHYCRTW